MSIIKVIKGVTRSLDYSSYNADPYFGNLRNQQRSAQFWNLRSTHAGRTFGAGG